MDKDISKIIPQEAIGKVLNPTADVLGESLGAIAKIALYPLLLWGTFIGTNLEKTQAAIQTKVNNIPIENRDPSKIGIALKAIEDSKYQLDNDILREMFENLVASSVDNRVNTDISPRYSMVLSQLTPDEARYLNEIHSRQLTAWPYVSISSKEISGDGFSQFFDKSSSFDLDVNRLTSIELYLITLQSLGIIEVTDGGYLTSDVFHKFYSDADEWSVLKALKFANPPIPIDKNNEFVIRPGFFRITSFGSNLMRLVC